VAIVLSMRQMAKFDYGLNADKGRKVQPAG
jgi:hypothetical protein